MQQKTSFSLGISPLPDNPDFVKFNKTFKAGVEEDDELKWGHLKFLALTPTL